MSDLFGNKLIEEESFEIIYKGSSFTEGKILIKDLYIQLEGLESLVKDSLLLLIKNNKIPGDFKEYKIYIEIEKGSIIQKIKIHLKNPTTWMFISTMVSPMLNTTLDHFLNGKQTQENHPFYQEIKTIEGDNNFKSNIRNILSPLNNNDDNVIINNGSINITINYDQKEEILKNLEEISEIDNIKKNGEYDEILIGVIRKIDLDATGNNYFGFNIDDGATRVPTSIRGEFNLINYKEVINEPIKIKAHVKYIDDQIKHIQIENYELVNKQDKLNL